MQTQWRVGFGAAVGLDYLAVERVAQMLGIRMDRMLLEKIAMLENRQLQRFGEIRARGREGKD